MARKLSNTFIEEFLSGSLKDVLEYVKSDHTLDMELRGSFVEIYYRGSCIIRIHENGFKLEPLDKGFCIGAKRPDVNNIEDYFPRAKHFIDLFNTQKKENWETEIQQQIVRENNYSPNAMSSDYFIVDIEYTDGNSRADIVALRWDSTGRARGLRGFVPELVMMELKQGISVIDGECGIIRHIHNFEDFIKNKIKVEEFKDDMIKVFQQKRKLELIPCLNDSKYPQITEVKPEINFVTLLANYDSESKKIRKVIEEKKKGFDL